MSGNPQKPSAANLKPIAVPAACRPRLGPNPVPLQTVCERAKDAMDVCVADSGTLLPELISKMAAVGGGALNPEFKGHDLIELMRAANDVRGVAQMLGSELTADIADAVFDFAEKALPDGTLPRGLIGLLAQSSQQLVGYRRTEDGGQLQRHVQDLLVEVRAKIARLSVSNR